MGTGSAQRRGAGEAQSFRRQTRRAPRTAASDSARELRLGVLEGAAPTLIHQVAQPLAATGNYLECCALQIRSKIAGMEELLDDIERARAQAQRAIEIIRNLREYVLQGRVALRSEALRGIVDEAIAGVSGIDAVDVALTYHDAGIYVAGDRVQLAQLFTNLFANAVQAMRDVPARRLRIVTAAAGNDIWIRIEDSGPGFTPDAHMQMWDPFFTTKYDGTGMGLPICATIVAAHGGRIWADQPAPGRGAAFNLLLPARADLSARNSSGEGV
jgi:two-component system sensor kinase FixL